MCVGGDPDFIALVRVLGRAGSRPMITDHGGRRHWHPQHADARHSKLTQMVARLTTRGDEMEIHVLKREVRVFRT